MRISEWAPQGFVGGLAAALLVLFSVASPLQACDNGDGCDTVFKGVMANPQTPSPAENSPAAADKPLALNPTARKTTTRKARAAKRDTPRPAPAASVEKKSEPEKIARPRPSSTFKNANALAQDPEISSTFPTASAINAVIDAAKITTGDGDQVAAGRPVSSRSTVIATDQINEIDRSAPGEAVASAAMPETAPKLAAARIDTRESTEVARNEDSPWGQTSLIGKIFIAVGGLLTAASALRMFMA